MGDGQNMMQRTQENGDISPSGCRAHQPTNKKNQEKTKKEHNETDGQDLI